MPDPPIPQLKTRDPNYQPGDIDLLQQVSGVRQAQGQTSGDDTLPQLSIRAPGQNAQGAPRIAPAGPSADTGPHAGLLRMVQGLALGLDSFAKAAATGGREGGVQEVQQVRDEEQRQQLAQQQEQRSQQQFQTQQQEAGLRMQTMNAQLLMQQAAYHHALQMYPAEEKAANLDVLNKATASYKDALAEGYDIADPAQASLWRQMQQNIISIPFSAGQSQQEVLSTASDAASKNGKNLVDYVPLASYNDGKHGTGGEITLVPAASLQQVEATPRQISMGMAQMKATLDTATAALGKDDPQVQALSGKIDTIQQVLDKGGKPSAYDFIQLNSSTIGPLSTRIAAASQTLKLQKEKADTIRSQQEAVNALPENQVALAGKKAAAEAKERQPYEVALKKMEAPIAAGVANNKDARDKITNDYLKPFSQKMQNVEELKSSLNDAENGNVAAAQAAMYKIAGLAVPTGSHKLGEAVADLSKQGSGLDQFVGKWKKELTGNRWTSAMSDDMIDFANNQAKVAQDSLRTGIKQVNSVYGTAVDPEAVIKASPGVYFPPRDFSQESPNDLKPNTTPQTKADKWGKRIR